MKKSILTLIIFIGSFLSFSQESGTFTDTRDGKVYKTVKIGSQIWMAENLAFKSDSCCWVYNNDQRFLTKYGYLYNWETAKTVCPTAWHLPSEEEFETLKKNCGCFDLDTYEALLPDGSSGFSARFGGCFGDYSSDYHFYSIGSEAYFWTSTPDGAGYARFFNIRIFLNASTFRNKCPYGMSVRCLKDN